MSKENKENLQERLKGLEELYKVEKAKWDVNDYIVPADMLPLMDVCTELADIYEKLDMKEECQEMRKTHDVVEDIYGMEKFRTYGY